MKKYNSILVLLVSLIVFSGCEEKMAYKYQDKPKSVNCAGVDLELLHEALYSFERDIAEAHNFRSYDPASPIYIINGYRNYIYKGSVGTADIAKIASPHSIEVFRQLQKIEGLWNTDGEHSNLNYDHKFVKCIMDKVTNETLQSAMINLREVNSLSPKLMAGVLRTNIREAETDPNFTMYVALDTYYQHFFDVDFTTAEPYE